MRNDLRDGEVRCATEYPVLQRYLQENPLLNVFLDDARHPDDINEALAIVGGRGQGAWHVRFAAGAQTPKTVQVI